MRQGVKLKLRPFFNKKYDFKITTGSRKPQTNTDYDCTGDDCDGGIPGMAGVDYPIYSALPKTGFDCKKQEWPGYYADTDAKCQVRIQDK
jgi:hypothetical protein